MMKEFVWILFILLVGCATHPQKQVSARDGLDAHQTCLLREQDEKKAIYDALPTLLKQVSGDSQIIAEHSDYQGSLPLKPTLEDIKRAISTGPKISEGPWGTSKEGHANTASGYVVRRSELSHPESKENVMLFHFSVGQPGRPFGAPLSAFRSEGNDLVADVSGTYRLTPTRGLPSERKSSIVKLKTKMRLRPIDNTHVLVLVQDQSAKEYSLNFQNKHALLVRTYPHRDFDTNDLWQDWPVYDEGEPVSACDSIQ